MKFFAVPANPNAKIIIPPQIWPKISSAIPTGIRIMFTHFRMFLLLIRTPKNQCASAGIINSETISAAINANVLVKASGINSFPSAASMVKTGMKLTIVVETAVKIAVLTSAEPL